MYNKSMFIYGIGVAVSGYAYVLMDNKYPLLAKNNDHKLLISV